MTFPITELQMSAFIWYAFGVLSSTALAASVIIFNRFTTATGIRKHALTRHTAKHCCEVYALADGSYSLTGWHKGIKRGDTIYTVEHKTIHACKVTAIDYHDFGEGLFNATVEVISYRTSEKSETT